MSMEPWEAEQEEGWNNLYNELGPQCARDHAYELYQEYSQQAIEEFRIDRLPDTDQLSGLSFRAGWRADVPSLRVRIST
jgi:hypothetical protein